ncbi:hypothetical protein GF314_10405 [bacterium]|nr:hypothetical protein [bacterium]
MTIRILVATTLLLVAAIAGPATAGEFALSWQDQLTAGTRLIIEGFYVGIEPIEDLGPPDAPQNLTITPGDAPAERDPDLPDGPAIVHGTYHAFLGDAAVLDDCAMIVDLGAIAREDDDGYVTFQTGGFADGATAYLHLSRSDGPLDEREWDISEIVVGAPRAADPGPPGQPGMVQFER